MICYDIKNDYNRAFLTIWGCLLEQKAYSRDRTSHHIPRNPRQYLFALLHKKIDFVWNSLSFAGDFGEVVEDDTEV
jgi:hypothetical protein